MVLFPVIVNAEEMSLPTNKLVEQKTELRRGATSSYDVVATLPSGQSVKVIDQFTNSTGQLWYRVDLGYLKGWVLSSAFEGTVKPPTPGETTPSTEPFNPFAPVTPTTENPSSIEDSPATEVPSQMVKIPEIGTYVYNHFYRSDVRRGANVSYASVASISLNQKMKVIALFTSTTGDVWMRVEVTSTKSGWIPLETASDTPALNQNLYVNVDAANLRNSPSLNSEVLDQASKGTILKSIRLEKDESGEDWYYAVTTKNEQVWVHHTVVSKTPVTINKSMLVGTKNASLFSGATYQYKVKEKLRYNSKVTVLKEFINSQNQSWLQVKSSSGQTGWTPKYEVISSSNDYEYVYALSSAKIRRGASTSYAPTLSLKENDRLIMLRELNGWLNVETSGGTRGWIEQSSTSTSSLKRLLSPTTEIINGDTYLNWRKPFDYSFTYSVLSGNRLKLSGGLTEIDMPLEKIPGISSIDISSINSFEKSIILTFEPGFTFTIRNNETEVSLKIIPNGLVGKKIIIDAGHGGKDTGAIGPTGLREKAVNLGTALLLQQELESYGAIVTLTRSTDIFLELTERTDIANSSDYDAFISIHADSYSSSSNGSTTYYNTTVNFNGPKSEDLGDAVQKHLVSALDTYNRGVKEQNFYVNKRNELPSILVELAFISNPREEALLKTTEFRQKAATGIRKGLEEYFTNF
jgi:N-acetylmuramoyl-L-alanine amidase